MKKFVLLICTLICALPCLQAQNLEIDEIEIDSTEINEESTRYVYAELIGWNNNVLGLNGKLTVEVDFGESYEWWGNDGRNVLVDENGKNIKFGSMVDAMNYMGERGWKFEAAYTVPEKSLYKVHWLMSKKISSNEDMRDGVNQKKDFKKKKKKKESNTKQFDDIYQ